jgi:co-chaperonin GroES (HSP10)
MMCNIIPAGHKILVRPKPVVTEHAVEGSNIRIIVQVDEERELAATTEGEVVALGPTAYLKVDDGRPWVQVGDNILYAKYAGAMAVDPVTKEKYVVIHDIDVVCVVKENQGEH